MNFRLTSSRTTLSPSARSLARSTASPSGLIVVSSRLGSTTRWLSFGRHRSVSFYIQIVKAVNALVNTPASEECRLPRPPLVDDGPDITTAVQFHRTDPTIIFVSYQFGRVSYVFKSLPVESEYVQFRAYTYSKNRAHQLWSIDHRCIW